MIRSDDRNFICAEETRQIIGCAMEVLNTLGHGLLEKPYENALVVELGLKHIPYQQQAKFDIFYKSVKVGVYIPDLIVFGKIIVDIKTIDRITSVEKGQILNYLKICGMRVGLILNFKYPKLQTEKVIL